MSPVSADEFTDLMAGVCSQVTVVSTHVDGRPYGTTVTSFFSLSLDPPMVAVSLDRRSRLLDHALTAGRIGVNLLSEHQEDVASRFAAKTDDKFNGAAWRLVEGLPYLYGVLGWLNCSVRECVTAGDHRVLFCAVKRGSVRVPGARPLVYGERRFGTHSALSIAAARSDSRTGAGRPPHSERTSVIPAEGPRPPGRPPTHG
ncbi:flavin reductase family protein [Streptomyces sp. NPDC005571]|uniref:flavin reductase family protein n=1 Tax=Streptomyces sp. NPDC005571 TaxID=3156888 RepID=UPI0033A840F9